MFLFVISVIDGMNRRFCIYPVDNLFLGRTIRQQSRHVQCDCLNRFTLFVELGVPIICAGNMLDGVI